MLSIPQYQIFCQDLIPYVKPSTSTLLACKFAFVFSGKLHAYQNDKIICIPKDHFKTKLSMIYY